MPEHEPDDRPRDRPPDRSRAQDPRTGRDAARTRMQHQNQWVEQQLRVAMERGEFDNLPGAGKPIEGLGTEHDPDWWLKKLIERERITGVLPEALQLRKDDLELAALLDRQPNETHVRRELESFNARVVRARMQLQGGPPVITKTRDVEAEVAAWHERRRAHGHR